METFSNISNSEKQTASLNIYCLSTRQSRMIYSLLLLTKSIKIFEYTYKLNQNLLNQKYSYTFGLLTNENVSFPKIICFFFYFHLFLFIQFNLLSHIAGGTISQGQFQTVLISFCYYRARILWIYDVPTRKFSE